MKSEFFSIGGKCLGLCVLGLVSWLVLDWSVAKWLSTDGFFGSTIAYLAFDVFMGSLLTSLQIYGHVCNEKKKEGFSSRQTKWLTFVLTCLIGLFFAWLVYWLTDVFSFAKFCWWTGFWNSVMSISAFALSVVGIPLASFEAVVVPFLVLFSKVDET